MTGLAAPPPTRRNDEGPACGRAFDPELSMLRRTSTERCERCGRSSVASVPRVASFLAFGGLLGACRGLVAVASSVSGSFGVIFLSAIPCSPSAPGFWAPRRDRPIGWLHNRPVTLYRSVTGTGVSFVNPDVCRASHEGCDARRGHVPRSGRAIGSGRGEQFPQYRASSTTSACMESEPRNSSKMYGLLLRVILAHAATAEPARADRRAVDSSNNPSAPLSSPQYSHVCSVAGRS